MTESGSNPTDKLSEAADKVEEKLQPSEQEWRTGTDDPLAPNSASGPSSSGERPDEQPAG